MTKQEQIENIRQKCVEANPEIIEVKVGCEVVVGYPALLHTIYEVSRDGVYTAYLNRPFPEELEVNDFYDCQFSGGEKGLQILGRPIRLADILLAIANKYGVESPIFVNAYGGFYRFEPMSGLVTKNHLVGYWNLRADDLNEQSPETINWLYELLK